MPFIRYGFIAVLAAAIVLALYMIVQPSPDTLDEEIRQALIHIGENRSYAMNVETLVTMYDRDMTIKGTYYIDDPRHTYASFSTTTLRVPETNETHTFSLGLISINNDSYIHITTSSPLLKKTLPLTPWQHVSEEALQSTFKGIATKGPILDTALIFSNSLRYLHFRERGEDAKLDDSTFERYVFSLSDPNVTPGGTLQTLFERVGGNGTIEVWARSGTPELIVLSGERYHSTTTLLSIPIAVTPPEGL